MSGGGAANTSSAQGAAANAQASGTAGTTGNAVQNANTPQWMQGLLGAMTGNQAYGKSAPATHQLLQAGMSMMQPGMPQSPQSMARPAPQGGGMPYPGAQGMSPPGAQPMQPGMPGAPPQGAPGQAPQNPWLTGIPGH